jgi:glyoxylase-like metal-dependent hydrolase (beta-lactamase superfamily II)
MGKDIEKTLKEAQVIDVGETWFKVLSLPNNVYGIHEPHHWQEVISYLIIGSEKAILFDTGMGIKDISKVVKQLTDREVIVINSHTHFDHVGDNHRFEEIYVYDDGRSVDLLLNGQPNEALRHDMNADLFYEGYPEGFDPDAYVILPARKDQINIVQHGAVFDLGDRKVEVMYTPGHSTDAIMLLDRDNKMLFTGDTFYPDWLFAFFDDEWGESNLEVYEATMKEVAKLAPELDYVLPCHNKALVSPAVLPMVVDAFGKVNRGELEHTKSELYGYKIRIHDFEGFSILTKDE